MKTIDDWLTAYGVSHKNPTNKLIHWICVPAIMFSIIGLLWNVQFGFSPWLNLGTILVVATLFFYASLSIPLMIGFIIVGGAMLYGNFLLSFNSLAPLWLISIVIFVVAWIGQFIGHNIEGAKPSFIDDLKFLLIGPAWLLHFVYKKLGIPYQ